MSSRLHRFTSESVSMGHPDKLADQIADAVLDRVLAADPGARVACEVMVTGRHAIVAGEIATEQEAPSRDEIVAIARTTIGDAGYDCPEIGFDPHHADIQVLLQDQSGDIARGVLHDDGEIGAGDQGLMFGYATDQTPEGMPLPILIAHRLVARQAEARIAGTIPGLRPDAKSQVTFRYEHGKPVGLETVVLSTQHSPRWSDDQEGLHAEVITHVLRPVLGDWWDEAADIHVNPTGRFLIGGPAGDTGVTGRKIIVDTYGGWARHGGGAFSGKDPTKVDRSASYMARHAAKHVVAAGLAAECEVSVSYAIGVVDPTSVGVDTFGTGVVPDEVLEAAIREVFPFRPAGIIRHLRLAAPIYRPTAVHGHFGREPGEEGPGTFTWEETPHLDDLRSAAGV